MNKRQPRVKRKLCKRNGHHWKILESAERRVVCTTCGKERKLKDQFECIHEPKHRKIMLNHNDYGWYVVCRKCFYVIERYL
jgi:hypothetical protein